MAEKTKVVPNNRDGDEKEASKRQKIGEGSKTLSELEDESFNLLDKMAMDSILCEEDDALDDVTLLVNECRNPQDTWYKYLKRIVDTQGFDIEKEELLVEDLKKIPFLPMPHANDDIIHCCKVSINHFNQKEGTDYKFLKFVKGNVRLWGPGANLYLTFEAVPENSHPSTGFTVFQALVWTGSEPFSPYVKFVRPKPLQNASSLGAESIDELLIIYTGSGRSYCLSHRKENAVERGVGIIMEVNFFEAGNMVKVALVIRSYW